MSEKNKDEQAKLQQEVARMGFSAGLDVYPQPLDEAVEKHFPKYMNQLVLLRADMLKTLKLDRKDEQKIVKLFRDISAILEKSWDNEQKKRGMVDY